jgi:WD40 repeat protein
MIGQTLGNYRIVEQIGMGGMATVYKAFDPDTERFVAVKTLPRDFAHDADFRERFRREAKAIARLEHIHILPVFAYGEQDGTAYLVMRYLPTGTLSERIRAGEMPFDEISRLLNQLASALDYAHTQGVIHRDIKPSNVLLDDSGNLYLTDFGIAKIIQGTTLDLTGDNILGTPQYMSPEQCRGEKDLTPASDIYALGIVLYEMVTGRTPFNAETPLAVIYKQLRDPLPPPSNWRANLPEAAEGVILKALAKEALSRHRTCTALAQAFAQAVSGATGRQVPATVEPPTQVLTEGEGVSPSVIRTAVQTPAPADAARSLSTPADEVPAPEKPRQTPCVARQPIVILLVALVLIFAAVGVFFAFNPPPLAVTSAVPIIADNVTTLSRQSSFTLEAPPQVYALAPNGATIATAHTAITLWAVDGAVQGTFGDEHESVTALAFNPAGDLLISGGADGTVRLWDVGNQSETGRLDIGAAVVDLSLSADGAQLAVADDTPGLSIWDIETQARVMTMSLDQSPNDIVFLPDNNWIALSSDAGLYYAAVDGSRIEPAALIGGIERAAFNPAAVQLAAAYSDGNINLFDTNSAPFMMIITATLTGHETPPTGLAFSADGSLLLSGGADEIRVWSTASGGQRAILEAAADGDLLGIALSADGGTVIAVSDTQVTLWRAAGETAASR